MDVRRASVFLRLALALAGAVVGLLAVDRYAAWLDRHEGERAPGLLLKDERLGWVNRPGFAGDGVTTNALGLRGPPLPEARAPDEVRVLVVGDSRLFGDGVADDEVWRRFLQASLDAEGRAVRVLNGAVNSYSAVQSARRGIELIPAVEPDVVVLFLSPGEDILDTSAAGRWARVGGRLVPADVVEDWPAPLRPAAAAWHDLLGHLHLYVRHRAAAPVGAERPESIRHFVLSGAEPPPAAVPLLERTRAELRALADACAEAGAALRVGMLPEYYQIGERVWEQRLRDFAGTGTPPPGTDRNEPVVALRAFLDDLGLETWSFYDEVSRFVTDPGRYLLADDAHWTAEGHRLIARALGARLREDGLLER